MKQITDTELMNLPFSSEIKIIWIKSNYHKKGESHYGVIFGDKIGWEDGLTDKVILIAEYITAGLCEVYLVEN